MNTHLLLENTLVLEQKNHAFLQVSFREVKVATKATGAFGVVSAIELVCRRWTRSNAGTEKLEEWSLGVDFPRERMCEIALALKNDFLTRQHHVTRGWTPPSREDLKLR